MARLLKQASGLWRKYEQPKKADANMQAARDKTKKQARLAGGLGSTDLTGGLTSTAYTQQALLAGKTKLGQ